MKNDYPLISVVMPTFNGSKTIKRAINSILSQTYPNVEVIVVDDQSQDNTEEVVKGIKDLRVKYIKLKEKGNGSIARNVGIKTAKGEFVAFLDDDDEWLNHKLITQYNYLLTKDSNEWKAVGCSHFNESKNGWKEVILEKEGDIKAEILLMKMSMGGGSSLLMTKKVLEELGGFNEDFQRHQDVELELRYLRKYKLAVVKEPLVRIYGHQFRIHGKADISKSERFLKAKIIFLDYFDKDIKSLGKRTANQIYARNWLQISRYFSIEGNIKNTVKYLFKSLSYTLLFSRKFKIIPFETYFVIPVFLVIGVLKNIGISKK